MTRRAHPGPAGRHNRFVDEVPQPRQVKRPLDTRRRPIKHPEESITRPRAWLSGEQDDFAVGMSRDAELDRVAPLGERVGARNRDAEFALGGECGVLGHEG